MLHTSKPVNFMSAALLYLASATIALADGDRDNDAWITRHAVQTETGQKIPAGAFGIAQIARPREAMLLQLRGMAGHGVIILRSGESETCLKFKARFVAGDFNGDSISGHLADPVHLILKSRRVAKALANGLSIISDEYRFSPVPHPSADIVIAAGLDKSYNFVLSPGRNILSDIIGLDIKHISCTPI